MKEQEIIRLITENLKPAEKSELFNHIIDSPEGKEEYYNIKNLWALISQSKVDKKAGDHDISVFRKGIRNKKLGKMRVLSLNIAKYAAVIFVALFFGKILFQDTNNEKQPVLYNEVSIPAGQMGQLLLSDGTSIYINSCSKLKYPPEFKGGIRKVYLEGEAFFDVSKGRDTFIVETNQQTVKVFGTKFNVLAYPNDKYYQTTLVEGRVSLYDSQGGKLADLKPREQHTYDFTKNVASVKSVNTRIYDSWKDGVYIFDHETLEDISARLERVFAIRIRIGSDSIKNYKFTGTISRNISFNQMLNLIKITAPVKYKVKEKHGVITEVLIY